MDALLQKKKLLEILLSLSAQLYSAALRGDEKAYITALDARNVHWKQLHLLDAQLNREKIGDRETNQHFTRQLEEICRLDQEVAESLKEDWKDLTQQMTLLGNDRKAVFDE